MKILIPIRIRLTFWYTLIVIVTFMIFGSIAYYSIQQELFSSLDETLRNEASWLQKYIEPRARKVRLNRAVQKKKLEAEEKSLKSLNLKLSKEIEIEKKIHLSSISFGIKSTHTHF